MSASEETSAAAEAAPPVRTLAAAAWMAGAIASFSLMAVAGRELAGDFSTFEILFWRSLVGLAVVALLLALSRRGWSQLRTERLGLHGARNVAHFFGQNCWFYAVGVIPLAQVFALEFTTPIWVALLAPLVLGEALTRARALAAMIGFAGILLVTRPFLSPSDLGGGGDALLFGQAVAAAAAIGFAGNIMLTKRLSRTDSALCILFYMTLSQAAMAILCELAWFGAPPPWPEDEATFWLVFVGLTGLSAHYCLTSAINLADAAVVAPMDFFRLPVIAVVAAALYGEAIDAWVVFGGALVFVGNFINLNAERRRRA